MHTYILAQVLVLLFYFLLTNKNVSILLVDHSIAPGQCGGIVYIDT